MFGIDPTTKANLITFGITSIFGYLLHRITLHSHQLAGLDKALRQPENGFENRLNALEQQVAPIAAQLATDAATKALVK